ncbi:MAG: hypothetical protein K6F57_02970 [Candidatus Saccharibacteria bacterium]|nr:hypothetical protein [Candidatus Saccharibacteria bacterium]
MLRKLIKYDFLWMNRNMVIIFAITAILSILTRIASNYTDSVMGEIIFGILRGFTIAAFANAIINSAIRIWERFRQSFYKDEAYLTHTLPVSKNTLYDSKTLSGLCAILLSLAVVVACFFIAFWNNDIYAYFRTVFKDGDMTIIVVGIFVTAILEVCYAVNVGMFSLTVGHRSNNGRIARSVILGIFLYFALQSILLAIIYSIGMFDDSVKAMFGDASDVAIGFSTYRMLIIVTDAIYLVLTTALYFFGRKLFSKGVNVE